MKPEDIDLLKKLETQLQTKPSVNAERRRYLRLAIYSLFLFVLGTAYLILFGLGMAYLISQSPTFSTWRDWIFPLATTCNLIMAAIVFLMLRNEWTEKEENEASVRIVGYLLKPVVFVLYIFAALGLFKALGW